MSADAPLTRPDWRAVEVTCRAGPGDAPYEERHDWASVAGVMSGAFTYRSDTGRALLTPGSLLLGNVGTCFACSHEHGAGTALALDADAAPRPGDGREVARAAAAARIIEARYAEPLTIAGLAREVGLTQRRLAHVFRQSVGVTPYNYIIGRRLDAAAARLLAGPEGVLEIALDVGFGDLSEFTRRFRSRFGRPPAAFRRQGRAP
jgi:AraC-like DNA-binding protein